MGFEGFRDVGRMRLVAAERVSVDAGIRVDEEGGGFVLDEKRCLGSVSKRRCVEECWWL